MVWWLIGLINLLRQRLAGNCLLTRNQRKCGDLLLARIAGLLTRVGRLLARELLIRELLVWVLLNRVWLTGVLLIR